MYCDSRSIQFARTVSSLRNRLVRVCDNNKPNQLHFVESLLSLGEWTGPMLSNVTCRESERIMSDEAKTFEYTRKCRSSQNSMLEAFAMFPAALEFDATRFFAIFPGNEWKKLYYCCAMVRLWQTDSEGPKAAVQMSLKADSFLLALSFQRRICFNLSLYVERMIPISSLLSSPLAVSIGTY